MKELLEKLMEKQEHIAKEITNIRIVNAIQTEQLKEHMKRTAILETHTEKLFAQIMPIQKTVNQLDGVLKFFGVLAVVVGLVAGVISIIRFF